MVSSYLADFLVARGYNVHGIIRRGSTINTKRLDHLYNDSQSGSALTLHYGDLLDGTNLTNIISRVLPSEIYNLGAQSHVKVSFELAEYTGDVDGLGILRILNAIRSLELEAYVRLYQASTSEMYGVVAESPQNELTAFRPRSPYGVAKLFAHWTVVNYREAYGMFACSGILFNHESHRRGRTFVTRKVTRAVAEIHLGISNCLYLGNLDAMRDWGHAKDYVEGMWRMLQQDAPEDFVLASGESHSVREFVKLSFQQIGVSLRWEGVGEKEVGVCKTTGRTLVKVDRRYFRPTEVDALLGDPTKARVKLGWWPTTDFPSLVAEMVAKDIDLLASSLERNEPQPN